MNTRTSIEQIEQRAYAATLEDGLTELLIGVFLCITSGALRTPFSGIAIVFLPALIVAMKRLKNRYTYPRSGYAEPVKPTAGRLLAGIALYASVPVTIFIIVFLLLGDLATVKMLYQWMPVLIGSILSGGMYATWKLSGLRRFSAYTLLSPLAGAAVAMVPFDRKLEALSMWTLVMAFTFASNGIWRFARLLRSKTEQR